MLIQAVHVEYLLYHLSLREIASFEYERQYIINTPI